jgi:hypothetical protein
VAWDAGCFGDAADHSVDVTSVDRVARQRAQDQVPRGAFAPACFEDAEDRDGQGHRGRLVSLAYQVKHPMASQCFPIVLDPYRGSFGCS